MEPQNSFSPPQSLFFCKKTPKLSDMSDRFLFLNGERSCSVSLMQKFLLKNVKTKTWREKWEIFWRTWRQTWFVCRTWKCWVTPETPQIPVGEYQCDTGDWLWNGWSVLFNHTAKTQTWFSQTQNMATSFYLTCALFIFLALKTFETDLFV